MSLGLKFGQRQWPSSLRVLAACLADSSDTGLPGAEAAEDGKNKQGKNQEISLILYNPKRPPFLVLAIERGFSFHHHCCKVGLILSYFSNLSDTIYHLILRYLFTLLFILSSASPEVLSGAFSCVQ